MLCRWLFFFFAITICFSKWLTAIAAPSPVDTSTLSGKLIMGYQGWFACPGDVGSPGWTHWKAGAAFAVDMLPDASELGPAERCDSGLVSADGKPIYLFSSENPRTVDRHFAWMEERGISGIALQKFALQTLNPSDRARADLVLDNVRKGAERHGRAFFLMYDLTGMPPDKLGLVLDDWRRLVAAGLTKSPAYLHHRGRPLLGLWGLGFVGRNMPATAAAHLLSGLKGGGISILGGVPVSWRLGSADASPDPGWKSVWPQLDVLSPWSVGRFADDPGADHYRVTMLDPDIQAAKTLGVDYMPVIFPGFSWTNLKRAGGQDSKLNQIPRRCGAFYWRQARNALAAGATMVYSAMFDEVDEGTAMFKIVPRGTGAAAPGFVTLDIDGCSLPSDWFLRLAGLVGKSLAERTQLPLQMPKP